MREGIADRAGQQGDGDIAGMVEGRVAPHAPRELLARVEAQGQGRDRGTEDVAGNGHQAVGDRDRPESRPDEDNGGRDRQNGKRQDDDSALRAGFVDRRADRRLDCEPEQAAERRHQADFGLAPMLLGDQEHIEIGSDRAAHVGERKLTASSESGLKRLPLVDVTATATASRSPA